MLAKLLPSRPQRWELVTGTPPGTVWASDEKGRTWMLEPDGWKQTGEAVSHQLGRTQLRHAPGGFFQVCAPWAMKVFGDILAGWDIRGKVLYDLYSGVGLFSMLLKERFQRHVLVESGEASIAWARRNLEGFDAEFHCAEVAEWLLPGSGNT